MPVLQKMFLPRSSEVTYYGSFRIYKQWAWKLNTRHLSLYESRTKCEHMWGDASLQILNIHHWATCAWEFIALQPKTVPSRNELLSSQMTFNTKKKKKPQEVSEAKLTPSFFSLIGRCEKVQTKGDLAVWPQNEQLKVYVDDNVCLLSATLHWNNAGVNVWGLAHPQRYDPQGILMQQGKEHETAKQTENWSSG